LSELFCYVVSYDIMDEKRLQKVHKAMLGFGEPIHYSVFRCDLTAIGRVQMIEALSSLIEKNEDQVMIIDLGPSLGDVEERIEFIGADHPDLSLRNAIIV